MKLWRKNKRADSELPSFLIDGLRRINVMLIAAANFLQQKTNRYSDKKKKVFLALFTIVFATESCIVLVKSFRHQTKTPFVLTRINTIPIETAHENALWVTKAEFSRIKAFKNYIDSLGKAESGRKIRDSLLYRRPNLMDSVEDVMNLYLQQSKTK